MNESTLKHRLNEWQDWDVAAYCLGICLGLMSHEPAFGGTKHVFWTNHTVGKMLYTMLDLMVAEGILEKRDEPDTQYRWSSSYCGSWQQP